MSAPRPRPAALRSLLELLLDAIREQATVLQLDGSYEIEIGPLVDQEGFEALSAEDLMIEHFAAERATALDFGCGGAAHRPFIEEIGYAWHGVDYLEGVSETVRENVMKLAGEISFYDGKILPFDDASFDVVWAMLVLQHVQSIDLTFSEIARVLKPGGRLIGQVSYLEQAQDYGTFNFTPIGMKVAAAQAGLRLTRIYPKHDAFSFLLRRLHITLGATDETPFNEMMGPEGYFHHAMIETGEKLGCSVREINLLRLLFCTHFVFEIERPA